MKKIGLDARLYSQTGNGVYIQNFIHFLLRKRLTDKFYIYLLPKDFESVKIKHPMVEKKIVKSPLILGSSQNEWLVDLNKDKLDLMHFNALIFPVQYKGRFVATIHDITHIISNKMGEKSEIPMANRYMNRLYFETILNNASRIFTSSNATKNKICKLFGEKYRKLMLVITLGLDYRIVQYKSKEPSLSRNSPKVNAPFFIYVGECFPHKNVERLVCAFSKLEAGYKLYLLGPDSQFYKNVQKLINTLQIQKRVIHIKDPNYENLSWFYKHALALIHPSLVEGFGLPILEASYFGCPVIASKIDPFQELLSNYYLSFNPQKINDIYRKLEFFIKDHCKKPLRINMNKYSFSTMVDNILNEYKEILYW